MDHQIASTTQAVERYLLDELAPEERDEFEEHFFGCPECADAVRTGTVLTINGREVAKELEKRPSLAGQVTEMPTRPARSAWPQWMTGVPAAAAAVLVAVVSYQNFVTIPQLRQSMDRQNTEWASAHELVPIVLRSKVRSSAPPPTAEHGKLTALILELNVERPLPAYSVEVKNEAGETLFRLANAPVFQGSIELALPSSKLSPGMYEILVRGQSQAAGSPEIGPFTFQIEK